MYVVATAGHVDHGKSTLVQALTGMQPDRLDEERRRGLSIQLGYCWTSLPGVGDVAFVDVPGHERFLATTLSGLGPVPVVMFVVAADDPWMPQAAEHLAALDALRVDRGLLVVTRCDLADPDAALASAGRELAGTSLEGLPTVAVSGRTGAGLSALRATLADVLAEVPEPDPTAPVRLWVDRRFHVPGAGTVVTGTLAAGTITVGDTLHLEGRPVRVRGLECLDEPTSSVHGTARVAVNLGGAVPTQLGPGDVLVTPDEFEWVATLDCQLSATGAGRRARGLVTNRRSDGGRAAVGDQTARLPAAAVLHVGAAHVRCRVRRLGDDFARLTLERALPLRIGERAILRDPGSRALWGVLVLDPAPPSLRMRGAARARAAELATFETGVEAEVARRGMVRASLLRRLGVADVAPATAMSADGGRLAIRDWLVSAQRVQQLRTALLEAVRSEPDPTVGLPVPAAVRKLGLPDSDLLTGLAAAPLRLEGGRVLDADAAVDLPQELLAALAALREELDRSPFAAPTAGRLAELGLDLDALARLDRHGLLLRLDGSVVLLPDAPGHAVDRLKQLPQPFSVSEARQALESSRRVIMPLMSYMDRAGVTVRLADDRRRIRDSADSHPLPVHKRSSVR